MLPAKKVYFIFYFRIDSDDALHKLKLLIVGGSMNSPLLLVFVSQSTKFN